MNPALVIDALIVNLADFSLRFIKGITQCNIHIFVFGLVMMVVSDSDGFTRQSDLEGDVGYIPFVAMIVG